MTAFLVALALPTLAVITLRAAMRHHDRRKAT